MARGLHNVHFENPVPYEALPARIHKADILLGVFDAGAKAGRVIPNKVFQALACGRPVVTRQSAAYPPLAANGTDAGLHGVESGNPGDLARVVAQLAQRLSAESGLGRQASTLYLEAFSDAVIAGQMQAALASTQTLRGR